MSEWEMRKGLCITKIDNPLPKNKKEKKKKKKKKEEK